MHNSPRESEKNEQANGGDLSGPSVDGLGNPILAVANKSQKKNG